MMNSTTGEDGNFPENPFRSTLDSAPDPMGTSAPIPGATQVHAQQIPQQDQFFSNQAPAFAQPPAPMQHQPNPMVQQQPQYQQTQPMAMAQGQTPYTQPSPASFQPTAQSGMSPSDTPQMSRWQLCTSCFKMETYMAYFDIDATDIYRRLKYSILYFYLPDKFRSEVIGVARTDNMKGPDLYGPLWITMTLVFFLAVTSNLSAYLRTDNAGEFEYDISHLVHAMTVCFGFVLGIPALWWILTQCLGMQCLMMVDWICLYGYSMVPYIPSTLFCLIPSHAWIWICLIITTGVSGGLVVRNVASALLAADTTSNKAGPILIAVMVSHVIFLLVLKLTFYN